MRKCLLILGLLSTSIINAQSKKPVVKKKDAKQIDTAVKVENVSVEAFPDEGIVAPPAEEEVKVPVNDLYKIYGSYPERNLIIAYVGDGYKSRRFGLLEYNSKKKITPFIFEDVFSFYKNELSQVKVNSKYGVINAKGQVIVPCIYDEMSTMLVDGMTNYVASKAGRYGIVNGLNETVIPFEYDKIVREYHATAFVSLTKSGKSGLMNIVSRKMVIPAVYDHVSVLSGDMVKVQQGNSYCLFKMNGEPLFTNWYTKLEVSNDHEYALVELMGKKGVVNMAEKKIIPCVYDVLDQIYSNFSSSTLFVATKDGKQGIIAVDGKLLLPLKYDQINYLADEMVKVTKNDKKGVFSVKGTQIMPIAYDEIANADRNFLIKKDNKFGIANRTGNIVLPIEFDALSNMSMEESYDNAFLLASRNGKKGIVEVLTGKSRVDFIYDDLIGVRKYDYKSERFGNSIVAVKDGKYGMIDINGTAVVPFIYNDLQYLNSYLVIAVKDGKYGVVETFNNNVVLPFEFRFINHEEGAIVAYKNDYELYKVTGKKITKSENQ